MGIWKEVKILNWKLEILRKTLKFYAKSYGDLKYGRRKFA